MFYVQDGDPSMATLGVGVPRFGRGSFVGVMGIARYGYGDFTIKQVMYIEFKQEKKDILMELNPGFTKNGGIRNKN